MEYKYYKEVTGELVRVHIEQDTTPENLDMTGRKHRAYDVLAQKLSARRFIKKIVILITLIS